MDRRVEVGAGVLAGAEVVPVPGRPGVVVARDQLEFEARRLAELLGQFQQRSVGRERRRQVDDLDGSGREPGDEHGQGSHRRLLIPWLVGTLLGRGDHRQRRARCPRVLGAS